MDRPAARLPVLALGSHVLDESNARLTLDNVPLDLPPKAFAVLCHLARNAQRLVTKDELHDAIWGHRHVSESVLKTTINLLRMKLGDDPRAPRYIETVSRRGYRFVARVAPVATAGAPAPARVSPTGVAAVEVPPTILAVDDEPDLVWMIEDYLSPRGFRVLTAGSTQQARSILGGTEVDLVLLDVTMPGEDGLSLARYLREHGGPPVILVTSLDSVTDKVVGLEVGADDYVTKPFDTRELLARIKNLLRRSDS